jgi:hypothetical protein
VEKTDFRDDHIYPRATLFYYPGDLQPFSCARCGRNIQKKIIEQKIKNKK